MTVGIPKRKKAAAGWRPLLVKIGTDPLDRLYVLSLEALRPLGHGELHRLTFREGAETARLDSGEVDEDILARLAGDEAIALSVVEPFHCSLFHVVTHSLFLMLRVERT